MNTATALTVVEREYGSLEEFVYRLMSEDELKGALDDSVPMTKRAEIAQVPLAVFAKVITSPAMRTILRVDLVNSQYTLEAEREHVKQVTKIARGDKRLVMNAKGNYGKVDQAPGDVIAAGKYLNELRGTPVESRQSGVVGGITINFHNANSSEQVEVTDVSFAVQDDAGVHQPARAGQLPPSGVLGRGTSAVPRPASVLGESSDGGLGDLYGERAEEADEAAELASKRRGDAPEPEKDEFGLAPDEDEERVSKPSKGSGPWPGRAGRRATTYDYLKSSRNG